MPKTKKTKLRFNLQDLEDAADEIRNGKSQRKVEKSSGIARGILHRFMNKGADALGGGKRSALGKDVEELLMKCILARATMNFPCSRKELLNLVQEYVNQNDLTTPFINGKPGKEWYGGFMERHADLPQKNPKD